MGPPDFPPPYVIERTRTLGFGTGPWSREQLVSMWGQMADKYVAEAKAAGWLVSPSRGLYYVPNASDIMTVSWLPQPVRSEFLIYSALNAAGIRAWCLSAWCRDQGLSLSEPVFVTDLTAPGEPPVPALDRPSIRAAATARANKPATLPYLDHLLIVPTMPAMSPPRPRIALVPEAKEAIERRQRVTQVGQAVFGVMGLLAFAFDKNVPELAEQWQKLDQREAVARGIPYTMDGQIQDEAWIIALLAAIGTSRIEELVTTTLRPRAKERASAIQRWASLFGPPQPAAAWKETMGAGPFPFLLVPPSLWSEMGADQAARRYRMLEELSEG